MRAYRWFSPVPSLHRLFLVIALVSVFARGAVADCNPGQYAANVNCGPYCTFDFGAGGSQLCAVGSVTYGFMQAGAFLCGGGYGCYCSKCPVGYYCTGACNTPVVCAGGAMYCPSTGLSAEVMCPTWSCCSGSTSWNCGTKLVC